MFIKKTEKTFRSIYQDAIDCSIQ